MTIVEQVFKESELPGESRGWRRDTVTLGWQDRTHAHGRRRTDGGVEFGTALPRGTVLRGGDCLLLEPDRLIVFVVERAEPVFVIEPRSQPEWALFAYHIGNRHQPVMITDSYAPTCPASSRCCGSIRCRTCDRRCRSLRRRQRRGTSISHWSLVVSHWSLVISH